MESPNVLMDGGTSRSTLTWVKLGKESFSCAANKPTLSKCSSLGPLGVLAASLSLASQWSGTGYTLGVNGNGLKANIVGADIAASVALVSDPAGNVGIARSL